MHAKPNQIRHRSSSCRWWDSCTPLGRKYTFPLSRAEVAEFLQSVNVSPEKIKSATEFVLAGCRIIPEAGQFIACDLTKNAYRTISSSLDEAQRNKREEADTLDLFIGCLHVKDGVAAIVLESFGVTLERTQTARARLNKPLTS